MKALKTIKEVYSERKKLLENQGYSSYQEYLKSNEWKTIKERVKKRTAPKWNMCNICGSKSNLDLHHSSYWVIGSCDPGNTVFPLCRLCHEKIHEISKKYPNNNLRFAFKFYKRILIRQGIPVFWKGKVTLVDPKSLH